MLTQIEVACRAKAASEERLRPFGMGNPQPTLLVPAGRFQNVTGMGEENEHSRFTLAFTIMRSNLAEIEDCARLAHRLVWLNPLKGDPRYQPLARGMAAPSDEALQDDIGWAKAFGFNGVRKHQKIEDPRYLYWADRLGLAVWEEMPSAYRFTAQSVTRLSREWTAVVQRDARQLAGERELGGAVRHHRRVEGSRAHLGFGEGDFAPPVGRQLAMRMGGQQVVG